jgi:hypothetical protein
MIAISGSTAGNVAVRDGVDLRPSTTLSSVKTSGVASALRAIASLPPYGATAQWAHWDESYAALPCALRSAVDHCRYVT